MEHVYSDCMVTHISRSPEETHSLGEALGRDATPGTVIGLIGELGAGKTEFIKGVAAGLEITERVHSPTFALVNEYRSGRVPCFPLALYRLETLDQIRTAGLEEYFFRPDAIVLIEWFDRLAALRPDAALVIRINEMSPTEREIA